MCMALLCCSLMIFTGCDNTQYSYAEFQSAYKTFVADNTGDLFDDDGYIKVTYKNETMKSCIYQTDKESKLSKFTRLSGNIDSNQAIFEPTLKASLVFAKNYVNVTSENVPMSESTSLYKKFLDLKTKAEKFLQDKKKFDNRSTFTATSALEISWLNTMLDDYYALVKTSCEFSQQYIELYNKYVFINASNLSTGRIASGKIEKYYIESLTKLADVYINSYLPYIYDNALASGDGEYYTDQNYSNDVNSALKSYLNIDTKIQEFEKRTGEMVDNEKAVVSAYNSAINYNPVFENSYKMVKEILPKVNLSKKNPTEIEKGYIDILSDFYNCEYKNLTELINAISQKIILAQS